MVSGTNMPMNSRGKSSVVSDWNAPPERLGVTGRRPEVLTQSTTDDFPIDSNDLG